MKNYISENFKGFEDVFFNNKLKYQENEEVYYAACLVMFYDEFLLNNKWIEDQLEFNVFLKYKFEKISIKKYSSIIKRLHKYFKNSISISLIKKEDKEMIIFFNNFKNFKEFFLNKNKKNKTNLFGEIKSNYYKKNYRCFVFEGELEKEEISKLKKAFEDLKGKEKVNEMSENPIYQYFNDKYSYKNGFFLNNAPTGTGKSYYSARSIVFQGLYNNVCKNEQRNIFYITNLKSNLNEVFEKIIENINIFCKQYALNERVKYFLLSKINLTLSQKDLFEYLEQQLEDNEKDLSFFPIFNKYFKSISTLRRKMRKASEEKSEEEGKIGSDLFREIQKCFIEHKEELTKQEELFISKIFLGNTIPKNEINSGNVYLMTTAKAMSNIAGLYFKIKIFSDIKSNDVFYIDELDKQQEVMLSYLINNVEPLDQREVIRKISLIKNINFAKNEEHGFDMMEKLRERFTKEKLNKFYERFRFNYNYKIDLPKNVNILNIFENKIDPMFIDEGNYIELKHNDEIFESKITVRKSEDVDEKEKIVNKKDQNNMVMFKFAMSDLIDNFIYFVNYASSIYSHKKNGIETSRRDKIRYILEELQLIELYSLFYNYNTFDLSVAQYDLYTIEVNRFIKLEENTVIKNKKLAISPEMIITGVAKDNLVIGISATSESKSKISNFDMDYLTNNLGEDFHFMTNEEKNSLSKYLKNKDDFVEKNIFFDIKTIKNTSNSQDVKRTMKQFPFFKNLNENGKNPYKQVEIDKIINAAIDFMNKETGRLFLGLTTALYDSKAAEFIHQILDYVDEDLAKNIKIFPQRNKKNNKYHESKADSDFFRNYSQEIYQYLDESEDHRVILLTCYNTVGAGANLQHKEPKSFNVNNYINIKKQSSLIKKHIGLTSIDDEYFGYDIDYIYIAEPKNLLVNIKNSEENEGMGSLNEVAEIAYNLKKLFISKEISRNEYTSSNYALKKGDKVKIAKLYKKTDDYVENVIAKIKQSIGRLERTVIKNKHCNISIDENIVKSIGGIDIKVEKYDPVIYKKTINYLNNSQNNEKLIINKDNRNNVSQIFQVIKKKIMKNAFLNEEGKEVWFKLREFSLKNGLFFDESKRSELIKLIGVDISYKLDERSCFYRYDINDSQSFINEYSGEYIVNEEVLGLNILKRNVDIVNFFETAGYTLNFHENEYTLPYNYVNDIYKGIIGEICCLWFFEKYLNIKLNDQKRMDEWLFEKADHFIINTQKIGVDAKNYDLFLNTNDHNQKLIYKISDKLNEEDDNKRLDKMMIVNTFLKNEEFSIKYGYINDGIFIQSENQNDNNVCVINGFINNDGSIPEFEYEIKKIMEWINYE